MPFTSRCTQKRYLPTLCFFNRYEMVGLNGMGWYWRNRSQALMFRVSSKNVVMSALMHAEDYQSVEIQTGV